MTGGGFVGFQQLAFVVTFLISSEVCADGGGEGQEGVGGGAEVLRRASQLRQPHQQVWACKSCLHTARVQARPRESPACRRASSPGVLCT